MVHFSSTPALNSSTSLSTGTSTGSTNTAAAATLMGPPPVPASAAANRPRLASATDGYGYGYGSPGPASAGPSSHRPEGSSLTENAEDDEDEVMSDDEEYAPGSSRQGKRNSASSSKTAGTMSAPGKSGMSRQSREARRKANHSLIERRRREKINAALAELRSLVPGLNDEKGGKAGEFKLEVLERTVEHLRELKDEVASLSAQLTRSAHLPHTVGLNHVRPGDPQRKRHRHLKKEDGTKSSPSPPTPSLSPESPRQAPSSPGEDSDSTELDPSLPPAVSSMSTTQHFRPSAAALAAAAAVGSGPFANGGPTVASLLSSSSPPKAHVQGQGQAYPSARPSPPASANNPTLYLPFPTPSPTSPFLTYGHGHPATGGSSIIEPSPFLAPIKDLGLFGGAVSLNLGEGQSPALDARERRGIPVSALKMEMPPPAGSRASSASSDSGPPPVSKPRGEKRRHGQSEPSPEEAANLLLAFSSPDTLRPINSAPSGIIAAGAGAIKRRNTLEDWSLDAQAHAKATGPAEGKAIIEGKSASDILKL